MSPLWHLYHQRNQPSHQQYLCQFVHNQLCNQTFTSDIEYHLPGTKCLVPSPPSFLRALAVPHHHWNSFRTIKISHELNDFFHAFQLLPGVQLLAFRALNPCFFPHSLSTFIYIYVLSFVLLSSGKLILNLETTKVSSSSKVSSYFFLRESCVVLGDLIFKTNNSYL